MQDLKNIIESLLFVTDEPLSLDKLKSALESIDGKEIRQALQHLCEEYEQRGGGFYLREVAGGWQLRSRPEYNEWIRRLLQPSPQRLSKAALETLAVIAYKQPIIRADIEFIRGVDCGGVLRQLMERKLIRVLGRKEIAGRPLIYATTKLFLELFDLKDLKDLPSPKEIAELTIDKPPGTEHTHDIPAAIPEETPPEGEPADTSGDVTEDAAVAQDQPEDSPKDTIDLPPQEQSAELADAEMANNKSPETQHADDAPADIPETHPEDEPEDIQDDVTEEADVAEEQALDSEQDHKSGEEDLNGGTEKPDNGQARDKTDQGRGETGEGAGEQDIQSNNT